MDRLIDQFLNLKVWAHYWDELLFGLGLTALLALAIIVSGLAFGLLLGLIRVASPRPVRLLIIVFADVFRAVPPLVVLVVFYFALPFLGIRVSGFACAWLSLALVLGAFAEESIYGGLLAIEPGQWEAARSTGFGFLATLVIIVFPQALRITVAPLTNRTIAVSKNTALGSVVAVPEVLNLATSALSEAANSTPLTMAALLYLLLFAPLVIVSRWLERRYPPRR
jgi:polar amino acid transport system permease protein